MNEDYTPRYRSLFWPILLIGLGALWLLANLGWIPSRNWLTVLRFWPIFLIAIGFDLIFGRRSALLGAVIASATVGVALLILYAGPHLDVGPSPQIMTERLSEPIGQAERAHIDLGLSVGPSTITTLSDNENLLEAEITHLGLVSFTVEGENEKRITLRQQDVDLGLNWLDWFGQERELRWDIGLHPDIPLSLSIEGGVGESDLDFSDTNLTGLELESGVGDMTLILPATGSQYDVSIKSGVGEMDLRILDGADLRLNVEGGVGDMTIDLPDEAAVRLEAEIGVGEVHVPSTLKPTGAEGERMLGEDGVWETEGYTSAPAKIFITYEGGVGDLTLR